VEKIAKPLETIDDGTAWDFVEKLAKETFEELQKQNEAE
jgi:hypothetical protein